MGDLGGKESGDVLGKQTSVYDWCPMKEWVQENDAVWQTGWILNIYGLDYLNLSPSPHISFSSFIPWGSCPIFWVKKKREASSAPLSVIAEAMVFAELFRSLLVFHKNKISYAKWVTWRLRTISPLQPLVPHAGAMLASHWHMDVISVTLTRFGFLRVREKGR